MSESVADYKSRMRRTADIDEHFIKGNRYSFEFLKQFVKFMWDAGLIEHSTCNENSTQPVFTIIFSKDAEQIMQRRDISIGFREDLKSLVGETVKETINACLDEYFTNYFKQRQSSIRLVDMDADL
jgi:hypothetical protein